MLLAFTTATLLVLLILAYTLGGRDILSPMFLFAGGFFACSLVAAFASDMWGYEMSPDAALVLIGCVGLYVAVSFFTAKAGEWVGKPQRQTATQRIPLIEPSAALLLFFAILQIATLILTLAQITQMFPADSPLSSISQYDHANKFANEGVSPFPFPIGTMRNICAAFAFFVSYMLAQELASNRRKAMPLIIGNFILSLLVGVETGSRGVAISYVVYFLVDYMLLNRAMNAKRLVSARALMLAGAMGVALVVTFQLSLGLLGRSSSAGFIEYLTIYIGSEIPNLDTFITTSGAKEPAIWGYMTFATSIKWLGAKLGIGDWVYQMDLPFQSMNNYGLGNVYTGFYAPIYDFGYVGLVVLVALMAALSQMIYQMATKLASGKYNCMWISLYAAVAFAAVFSFFSNKFYEQVLCISMARTLVYLLIILLLFAGVRIGRDNSALKFSPVRNECGRISYALIEHEESNVGDYRSGTKREFLQRLTPHFQNAAGRGCDVAAEWKRAKG